MWENWIISLLGQDHQCISTSAQRTRLIISWGRLKPSSIICLSSNTYLLSLWSHKLQAMFATLLWGLSSTRTKVPWNSCFFSKRWLRWSTFLQKSKKRLTISLPKTRWQLLSFTVVLTHNVVSTSIQRRIDVETISCVYGVP